MGAVKLLKRSEGVFWPLQLQTWCEAEVPLVSAKGVDEIAHVNDFKLYAGLWSVEYYMLDQLVHLFSNYKPMSRWKAQTSWRVSDKIGWDFYQCLASF